MSKFTSSSEFATETARLLHDLSQGPGDLYALIDQSVVPSTMRAALQGFGERQEFLRPGMTPSWHTPVLIPLQSYTTARQLSFARFVSETLPYANALSLLKTDQPLGQFLQSLCVRSRVELVGGLTAVFRWFDGRCLASLPTILSQDQWAFLCQPAADWRYVDRRGAWQIVRLDGSITSLRTISLSQAQEDALVEDGVPDAVLDQLLSRFHPALDGLLPPQQYDLIMMHLSKLPLAERMDVSKAADALSNSLVTDGVR